MEIRNDIIETWYFLNEEDAETGDEKKSVGYCKTVNGAIIIMYGNVDTKWSYISSRIEINEY